MSPAVEWFTASYFQIPVLYDAGKLEMGKHQRAALRWAKQIASSYNECKSELEVSELAAVIGRPIRVWCYDDLARTLYITATHGEPHPAGTTANIFLHRHQREGWDIVDKTPVFVGFVTTSPSGCPWVEGVICGNYDGSNHATAPEAEYRVAVNGLEHRVQRRQLHCRASNRIHYNEAHFSSLLPLDSVGADQRSPGAGSPAPAPTAAAPATFPAGADQHGPAAAVDPVSTGRAGSRATPPAGAPAPAPTPGGGTPVMAFPVKVVFLAPRVVHGDAGNVVQKTL